MTIDTFFAGLVKGAAVVALAVNWNRLGSAGIFVFLFCWVCVFLILRWDNRR